MDMDETTLQRRAEIARRLKAARWMCGKLSKATGRVGKPTKVGWKTTQLTAADLAKREPLAKNGWTGARIGYVERMERNTTPMELKAIAEALEMPNLFAAINARSGAESDLAVLFAEHDPTGSDSSAVSDQPDAPTLEPEDDRRGQPARVGARS